MLVVALLLGALALRVDGITQPSLSTRELHNALLARTYYLGSGEGLPRWQQQVVRELRHAVRPVEPPALDLIAAASFRLSGGERIWIPRLVSALAWVLGGALLFLIALRLTTWEGALVALALYLVWPYPVLISRTYMPDATMVALLLAGALAVIRYWERPSRPRLVVAAAVAALATAVKPGIALIFLLSLFVALAIWRRALREAIVRGRLVLFVALGTSLSVAWVAYLRFFARSLEPASSGRIDLHLLTTSWFWRGWREMLSIALPFPQPQAALAVLPLAVAIAGFVLADHGQPRAILGGLGIGYVAYALVFAPHTGSHPYYTLPLFPILALAIGVFVGKLALWLRARSAPATWAAFALVALVLSAAVYKSHAVLSAPYDGQAIRDYERIGRLTNHTTRALIVDERLRSPAMYWGWIVGHYWYPPTPDQDLPTEGNPFPPWVRRSPEFIVVVQTSELATERRLQDIVRDLPVVVSADRYVIFDARSRDVLP